MPLNTFEKKKLTKDNTELMVKIMSSAVNETMNLNNIHTYFLEKHKDHLKF